MILVSNIQAETFTVGLCGEGGFECSDRGMFFRGSVEQNRPPGKKLLVSSTVFNGPELLSSEWVASVANLVQFSRRVSQSAVTQDFDRRQLAPS